MKQFFIGILNLSFHFLILTQTQTVEQPRILQYGIQSSSFLISASANSTSSASTMANMSAQTSMNLAQQAYVNANASQLLAVTAATAANVSLIATVTTIASFNSLLASISALNIAQAFVLQAAQLAATYDSFSIQAQNIVNQQISANAASVSAAAENNKALIFSANLVQITLNTQVNNLQASCAGQLVILNIMQTKATAAAQAAYALMTSSNDMTVTQSKAAAVALTIATSQFNVFNTAFVTVNNANSDSNNLYEDVQQSNYVDADAVTALTAEKIALTALITISQVYDLASANANSTLVQLKATYNAALTLYQNSVLLSTNAALTSSIAGTASLTSSTNSNSSSMASFLSASNSTFLAGQVKTNATQTMNLANGKLLYNTNQCLVANNTLATLSGTQQKACQQLVFPASSTAQSARKIKCASTTSKFLFALSGQFFACSN